MHGTPSGVTLTTTALTAALLPAAPQLSSATTATSATDHQPLAKPLLSSGSAFASTTTISTWTGLGTAPQHAQQGAQQQVPCGWLPAAPAGGQAATPQQQQGGRLSALDVLRISRDVATGLAYLHTRPLPADAAAGGAGGGGGGAGLAAARAQAWGGAGEGVEGGDGSFVARAMIVHRGEQREREAEEDDLNNWTVSAGADLDAASRRAAAWESVAEPKSLSPNRPPPLRRPQAGQRAAQLARRGQDQRLWAGARARLHHRLQRCAWLFVVSSPFPALFCSLCSLCCCLRRRALPTTCAPRSTTGSTPLPSHLPPGTRDAVPCLACAPSQRTWRWARCAAPLPPALLLTLACPPDQHSGSRSAPARGHLGHSVTVNRPCFSRRSALLCPSICAARSAPGGGHAALLPSLLPRC